jgi:hypothetical protein
VLALDALDITLGYLDRGFAKARVRLASKFAISPSMARTSSSKTIG